MKDVIKIINTAWIEHKVSAPMDVRITMSAKGIKVNLGLGCYSNKPNSFDLSDAVLESCQLSLSWFGQILTVANNSPKKNNYDTNWVLECMKRKEMLDDIISELKKP